MIAELFCYRAVVIYSNLWKQTYNVKIKNKNHIKLNVGIKSLTPARNV